MPPFAFGQLISAAIVWSAGPAVRISKAVHEREEIINRSPPHEAVGIERVPIHHFVDQAIPVR
jgi:hypothetical protein